MTDKKPPLPINWNLLLMVGTVAIATISSLTWFNERFSDFESRLDLKYANKSEVDDLRLYVDAQTLKVTMNVISGLQNNLEQFRLSLVESGADPKLIKAVRGRIKSLRKSRHKLIEKYADDRSPPDVQNYPIP